MKGKLAQTKKTQKRTTQMKNPQRKNSFWWVIALAVIIVIGTLYAFNQTPPVSTEKLASEISVSEAHDYYSSGTFMLDVRQPEEFESGHIPGAFLIPLSELPDRLSEIPKDEPMVVVCRSGNRSATGRDILIDAGYGDVTSMAGGMNQWTQLGYETKKGPER